ncbi:MAG: energy-coupling factor transporter transmembrane protein EcfT [Clostridia bacterium]|nr:energy-coupling factor transporter transmembrane protein EcfT [Clostridia bacterium]
MLKDITLGQYFPGESILHRLDPRFKILSMFVFVVLVFFARTAPSFIYLLALLVGLTAISGIRFKAILKGLKPILFISVFTAVINLFWTEGEAPLISFWIITIYPEGIWRAAFMVVRIMALVAGSSLLLTYTTTPMDMTDALETMLSPLKKIRVPVHEFAMMMSLALRFVPTLIEETEKIINAQKARGADFDSGSIVRRAKALVPILVPLFVSSFSRASELATAMECRCYTGGEGRTRMNRLRLDAFDWRVFLILLVFFAGIVLTNYIPFPWGPAL